MFYVRSILSFCIFLQRQMHLALEGNVILLVGTQSFSFSFAEHFKRENRTANSRIVCVLSFDIIKCTACRTTEKCIRGERREIKSCTQQPDYYRSNASIFRCLPLDLLNCLMKLTSWKAHLCIPVAYDVKIEVRMHARNA